MKWGAIRDPQQTVRLFDIHSAHNHSVTAVPLNGHKITKATHRNSHTECNSRNNYHMTGLDFLILGATFCIFTQPRAAVSQQAVSLTAEHHSLQLKACCASHKTHTNHATYATQLMQLCATQTAQAAHWTHTIFFATILSTQHISTNLSNSHNLRCSHFFTCFLGAHETYLIHELRVIQTTEISHMFNLRHCSRT